MVLESRLKIPKSRIGVLIGKKGENKAELEKIAKVRIHIGSDDGSVIITSTDETPDPTYVMKIRDVVQAIGWGFSPKRAYNILDDDIFLESIELEGSKNNIKRIKSRIIGGKGKSKKMIETGTEALISVFGDRISIIGELEEIRHAREAIMQLIRGSKHGTVYRYLEQLRFRSRHEPLRIWKEKLPE